MAVSNGKNQRTIIYAPDPQNQGKFIAIGATPNIHFAPDLTKCAYCGGVYHYEKEHCPNCGGPHLNG